ncbi:MAG: hypothetical protein RLY20_473 [Verrucomicrobiota bacterium]|jgi:hypothetical protein
MKNCPWCGQDHPDDAVLCPENGFAIDIDDGSAPPKIQHANAEEAEAAAHARSEELPPPSNAPEGFHSLGHIEPQEAGSLLARFEAAGVQFQIEHVEKETQTGRGPMKRSYFEVFVLKADAERAFKILSADWKV